ncbi:MAG TPA: phage terminase large subunit, partial [Micavibrio sp.]|nr:phage terminase large subunit [Micavibrio sp.]
MTSRRCKDDDFSVFLSLWNVTQNLTTPQIHFRIATWLQTCWERGETRLLLQAFRASGKSSLMGLFSAWLLCRDPDLRILVLAAESSLSEKMARTIRKIVERHPLTTALRPSNPDQWAADSFTVNRKRISRDPSVLARGIHANITGTRADVIIYDDVEVPNTSDTADKREKLRDRLAENRFILTPGGTQIYIGTPHSYYSLYADTPRREIGEEDIFLKHYKRLSIPLLDKKGESAWPERYGAAEIEKIRRDTGPSKFASQMMLTPVNIADSRLDVSLLQRYEDDLAVQEVQKNLLLSLGGRKLVSASAWWDPAFGSASGDASVLAVVYTDEGGDYWLHRVEYISATAKDNEDEASLQCRRVAQIAKELFLPSIAVETNGIGKFLPAILRREL